MKSLKNIIQEKLVINRDTKATTQRQIEPMSSNMLSKFVDAKRNKSPRDENRHFEKMEEYQKKGSKPERLISTIKDNNKLINRWIAACVMLWDDAIQKFGEAIADRTEFSLDDLHAYVLSRYKGYKLDWAKHYLELYNIAY